MPVAAHTVTINPGTAGLQLMPITEVVFTVNADSTQSAISSVLDYLTQAVNQQSMEQAIVT